MGKRGPKHKSSIPTEWSPELAYAVGLLVSDGCLYNDGRHMSLTTKDLDQADSFKQCLGLQVKIGLKNKGTCYHIQFGNVNFYKFLISIGLTAAKSKTMSAIDIPRGFFFDYLRGYFDGDGSFYSYWDKRWCSSHMFYVSFACGSIKHIHWLREQLKQYLCVEGHITRMGKTDNYQLKYAKKEALEIISKMYYSTDVVCLARKREKILGVLKAEKVQQSKY